MMNRIRNKKDSFWSRADGLSIIDVLAISFSGVYLFLVVYALLFTSSGAIAIQLQSNMNFAITTILGGYFGDQIVQHWQRHKEEEETDKVYEKETI